MARVFGGDPPTAGGAEKAEGHGRAAANGEGAWGRRRCPTPDAEETSLNDDQGRDGIAAVDSERQQRDVTPAQCPVRPRRVPDSTSSRESVPEGRARSRAQPGLATSGAGNIGRAEADLGSEESPRDALAVPDTAASPTTKTYSPKERTC